MSRRNPQLLILVGAPGSGKTTFAKYHVRVHQNWVRLSRDDFRGMQFSESFLSEELEGAITEMMFSCIRKMLLRKLNVVADATHTKYAYIEQYIQLFGHMADISFKVFQEPIEKLVENCEKRTVEGGRSMSGKAVRHHFEALETLLKTDDLNFRARTFRPNITAEQDINLPKAIICDLDGTLALINDRDPFDGSKCENDTLNVPVASTLGYYKQNGYQVLLVSGREDTYRGQTELFLQKHQVGYDALWMRPAGTYIKDSLLKREIYSSRIHGKYYVSLVLDDRDQVVDMWRKDLKLPCFQVFYGDF
ncbi:phosphatase domain-containing protein [Arachidicoccus terrestris]|uniref:phosphatase domain-containing protein n=1 Tax=Arachidicoccus terrestris TaxID=2875539 RepID=UPI001CC6EE8F|nr:AAA family ATPase [Arachidicoccus terrestris]UAY53975.1 AAA family ATPase [Arachidicoccus terrestris]